MGWSMVLLLAFGIIGSFLCAHAIHPFILDFDKDEQLREFAWTNFGTFTRSVYSLFEITMAPGGFLRFRTLFDFDHPLLGFAIVIYVLPCHVLSHTCDHSFVF